MDETIWRAIDDAALRLHGACDSLELRTAFLSECGKLVPHAVSFFDLIGDDRGRRVFFDPVSLNMEKAWLDDYYARYVTLDYGVWIQEQPDIRPVYRDSDFLTDAVRRKSTLYREWLEPMGVDYGCSVIVSFEGVDYGTATFGKAIGQGDFTSEELEILRVLERHLALRMHQLAPNGFVYANRIRSLDGLHNAYHLTEREIEVSRLLCDGISIKRITEALHISPSTVRRHVANIYKKVGVGSRYELTSRIGPMLGE